jgi:hypothetical protein
MSPPSCHLSSPSPLLFIHHLPTICHPQYSLSLQFVICWHWCSLALAFTLALVFAGVSIHCHWHSLVLLLIVLHFIIISTTSTPYEQWLAGRVVALSDMAVGMGAAV